MEMSMLSDLATGTGRAGWSAQGSYPPSYAPRPQRLGRPILVSIFAILIGIVGFFVLLAGLLVLLAGLGLLPGAYAIFHSILGASLVIVGAVYFVLGIIMLAVARGLWDQEIWALWICGAVIVLELISSIIEEELLVIVILVLALAYLIGVRKHFS